jgi:hypothetical protein
LDLRSFVLQNYLDKFKNDAESSIDSFWMEYFGIETQVSFLNMKNAIEYCLKDLSITSNSYKKNLQQIMQLTPQRTRPYYQIDQMLKNNGVKDADRAVTLDGHDFACFSNDPIDFVTFDWKFYTGARNVKILCFNSVKGNMISTHHDISFKKIFLLQKPQ